MSRWNRSKPFVLSTALTVAWVVLPSSDAAGALCEPSSTRDVQPIVRQALLPCNDGILLKIWTPVKVTLDPRHFTHGTNPPLPPNVQLRRISFGTPEAPPGGAPVFPVDFDPLTVNYRKACDPGPTPEAPFVPIGAAAPAFGVFEPDAFLTGRIVVPDAGDIPAPGALVLLGLGAATVLGRRRRA